MATNAVLIPLRIRSISTLCKAFRKDGIRYAGLNPFENQVYFYTLYPAEIIGGLLCVS